MSSKDKNWNKIFDNIVKDIEVDTSDYDILSTWEVHRAVVGMNETATYLGRFLLEQAHEPNLTLNKKLTPYIRQLITLTNSISELLAICECPDCAEELEDCWCTEDVVCDNCLLDEDGLY